MRLELLDHTLFHCRGRAFLVLQRVWDVQHVPLRTAKLVEGQYVDMFQRVAEGLADLRHVLDVFFGGCPKSMVGWRMPCVTLW